MQVRALRGTRIWGIVAVTIALASISVQMQCHARSQETALVIDQTRSSEIQLRFPKSTTLSISAASVDAPEILKIVTPGSRDILARIPFSASDKIIYADPHELLVSLKRHQTRRHLNSWLKKNENAYRLVRAVGTRGLYLIRVATPGVSNPWERVEQLKREAFFQSVEVNQVAFLSGNQHGITLAREQWSLDYPDIASGNVDHDVDIDGIEALSRISGSLTGPLKEVVVAVMDSGIDSYHPALKNRLWVNPREINGNHKDDDKNGRVDDINGWNFADETNFITDETSHGTHVSGIIAAKPTVHEAMMGMAANTKIMVLKTFGSQPWSMLDINLAALEYGVNNGARVINMSWTIGAYSVELEKGIRYAGERGVYLVAAAGNALPGGKPDDISKPGKETYPCRAAFVLCVVATDRTGGVASFSNYSTSLQFSVFAAPGEAIFSTVPDGYGLMNGTSMASPLVAAAAAVIIGRYPQANSGDISSQLFGYSDLVPSKSRFYNIARLNLYRSMVSPLAAPTIRVDSYCEQVVENEVRSRKYPFANSGEAGIDGKTVESAFTICSAQQLLGIDSLRETLGKFFVVKRNLDWYHLKESSRHRIGASDRPFQGLLMGQGYTLANFRFESPPLSDSGLFAKIGMRGAVVNFRMSNVHLTGVSNVGALAGVNEGVIHDVQVEGDVTGIDNVGGVVGVSRLAFGGQPTSGLIRNVFFEGRVAGRHAVGGIAGSMGEGSTLDLGFAKGLINASESGSSGAGGAVGIAAGKVQISRSHALTHVLAGGRAGGLVGTLRCGANVSDSYSEGDVSAPIAGGLIGVVENSIMRSTYSLSQAVGVDFAGGLVGKNEDDQKTAATGIYACTGSSSPLPRSSVENSYYLNELNLPGAGGVGKSRFELQQKSTFDGWKFGASWMLYPGYSPAVFRLPRSKMSIY